MKFWAYSVCKNRGHNVYYYELLPSEGDGFMTNQFTYKRTYFICIIYLTDFALS